MVTIPTIPRAAAKKLGWYVYLYVNPLDGRVFYVGKGKGARAFAHLHAESKKPVRKVIRSIRAAGEEPRIELLAHGLPDEATALRVEAAVIDVLGLDALTNRVRGWRGRELGRVPLAEAVARLVRSRALIREPAILIRINDLYRPGMTDAELYDATRGAWKVGPKRERARYAFAVYEGVVREVYRITGWLAGGSTFAAQNEGRRRRRPGRYEFVGTLAEKKLRKKYVNKYVGHLFPAGAQNPVTYVNVD